MSKIPGTQANKEAKAEHGSGGGSNTGSGDLPCCYTLSCQMLAVLSAGECGMSFVSLLSC